MTQHASVDDSEHLCHRLFSGSKSEVTSPSQSFYMLWGQKVVNLEKAASYARYSCEIWLAFGREVKGPHGGGCGLLSWKQLQLSGLCCFSL